MAGIYIHIPFCKQACYYCNFHFSTSFEGYRAEMIASICKELEHKKTVFNDVKIRTIYFGGGTPSLLENNEIDDVFFALHSKYELSSVEEITIEANKITIQSSDGIHSLQSLIQSMCDQRIHRHRRALRGAA